MNITNFYESHINLYYPYTHARTHTHTRVYLLEKYVSYEELVLKYYNKKLINFLFIHLLRK